MMFLFLEFMLLLSMIFLVKIIVVKFGYSFLINLLMSVRILLLLGVLNSMFWRMILLKSLNGMVVKFGMVSLVDLVYW